MSVQSNNIVTFSQFVRLEKRRDLIHIKYNKWDY